MKVASAGQCVNSASSTIAGSSSSQPWMVAVRRRMDASSSSCRLSHPRLHAGDGSSAIRAQR